jgi:hypothetical protein
MKSGTVLVDFRFGIRPEVRIFDKLKRKPKCYCCKRELENGFPITTGWRIDAFKLGYMCMECRDNCINQLVERADTILGKEKE